MSLVIVVGSYTELKVRAVKSALHTLEEKGVTRLCGKPLCTDGLLKVGVESSVGRQPVGFEEMQRGAHERAKAACDQYSVADVGIGIESGLVQVDEYRWFYTPCVVVVATGYQAMGMSFGAFLPVPRELAKQARTTGPDIGRITRNLSGGNVKDPNHYLSKGVIERESVIAQAVLSAFAVLLNADEYRTFNPNE